MSDIFPPVEVIPAPPCRIDIIEYRRISTQEPDEVTTRGKRVYTVLFNGVEVGSVRGFGGRHWFSSHEDGFRQLTFYRTRGEAAAALIRSVYPDWKGCAP